MITFYPRDIGLWRKIFRFDSNLAGDKPKLLVFHDRPELIEFLKTNGVKLNDANYPLEFNGPYEHHVFGFNVYTVIQWTTIGWIKE